MRQSEFMLAGTIAHEIVADSQTVDDRSPNEWTCVNVWSYNHHRHTHTHVETRE